MRFFYVSGLPLNGDQALLIIDSGMRPCLNVSFRDLRRHAGALGALYLRYPRLHLDFAGG